MARIVIDASSTLTWLFDENGAAGKMTPVFATSRLVAPSLWLLEVTNAVLVRERRKLIGEAQAFQLLHLIDELPVEVVAEPISRKSTALAQMARPHQLSSYDAVYLELAVRMGIPLLTHDKNLRSAARRMGVELFE